MIRTPVQIVDDLRRAKRLEWWTLAGMASATGVTYLAMGSSQAMKTAFVEDLLSLIPAMTFLIAAKLEPRPPTEKYAFGFVRVKQPRLSGQRGGAGGARRPAALRRRLRLGAGRAP